MTMFYDVCLNGGSVLLPGLGLTKCLGNSTTY